MDKLFKTYLKQHFVYNSLNCAVSLCRKNSDDAAELLICLSECMHYTSENTNHFVLIKEEIDFLSSYLYIQSVRFSSRVKLVCEVDDIINFNIIKYSMYDYINKILDESLKNTDKKILFKIIWNKYDKNINIQTFLDTEMKYFKQFP